MGKKKAIIVTNKESIKINIGKTDDRTAKTVAALMSLVSGKKVTVEDEK